MRGHFGQNCHLRVIGILAKDPKIWLAGKDYGKILCTFSVIYRYKANQKRGVIFHFVCYRNLAEFIHLNYKKGDRIIIEKASGPEPNDYPDKSGKWIQLDRWKCWTVNDGTELIHMQTMDEDDTPD